MDLIERLPLTIGAFILAFVLGAPLLGLAGQFFVDMWGAF